MRRAGAKLILVGSRRWRVRMGAEALWLQEGLAVPAGLPESLVVESWQSYHYPLLALVLALPLESGQLPRVSPVHLLSARLQRPQVVEALPLLLQLDLEGLALLLGRRVEMALVTPVEVLPARLFPHSWRCCRVGSLRESQGQVP